VDAGPEMMLAFARQGDRWQNMTVDHTESYHERKRKRRSEQAELLAKLDSLLPDRARTKTFKSAVRAYHPPRPICAPPPLAGKYASLAHPRCLHFRRRAAVTVQDTGFPARVLTDFCGGICAAGRPINWDSRSQLFQCHDGRHPLLKVC
jgi:hypothetical protein